ncbi:783_t:CDS:2, partial [Racocetra fulgida]
MFKYHSSEKDFNSQRRYKLCAEQEKLLRERTSRQSSIKQEQNRDALRKFYERKAKEVGLLNCVSVEQPSINLDEGSETSQVKCPLKKNNSKNSKDLVERIKAGYTIIKFIKYHITRQRTRQILSELYKLRAIENHLISLKSTTNNNDLKDPIRKILEQLDKINFTDFIKLSHAGSPEGSLMGVKLRIAVIGNVNVKNSRKKIHVKIHKKFTQKIHKNSRKKFTQKNIHN